MTNFFSIRGLFILLAATIIMPIQVFAAENLITHKITPPTPASHYVMPYTANPVGLEKYALVIDGKNRSFYMYVPRSLKPDAPAIILLHGAHRTGISTADMWRNSAERHGILLVSPDADGTHWDYFNEKPFITTLVNFLKQEKRVNANRIYLFGHSSGAMTAMPMAAALSEDIAGAAVHAGMVTQKQLLPVINGAKRKIPVCVINGSDDKSIPAIRARYAAQLFASAGHPAAYIELAGHNHWYYTIADWINELAWQCMHDMGRGR